MTTLNLKQTYTHTYAQKKNYIYCAIRIFCQQIFCFSFVFGFMFFRYIYLRLLQINLFFYLIISHVNSNANKQHKRGANFIRVNKCCDLNYYHSTQFYTFLSINFQIVNTRLFWVWTKMICSNVKVSIHVYLKKTMFLSPYILELDMSTNIKRNEKLSMGTSENSITKLCVF